MTKGETIAYALAKAVADQFNAAYKEKKDV